MTEKITVKGVDVFVEGKGGETIVMIHGWPDTYRLWDRQVEYLKNNYRCVRFTLPGFDIEKERRLYTLQELVDIFAEIIDTVSPDKRVILMLHDWGCVFGYQYYMLHKERVSKIVGIDVGDAGSKDLKLPLSMVLFAAAYQLWLALAWNIGGKAGDGMTRFMAKKLGVKADINLVHSGMNYGYHQRWKHLFMRKSQGNILIDPSCPMLFLFGMNKPTMFHSQAFIDKLNSTSGSCAVGFETGHWVMLDEPEVVTGAIGSWLGASGREKGESAKPAGVKPAVKGAAKAGKTAKPKAKVKAAVKPEVKAKAKVKTAVKPEVRAKAKVKTTAKSKPEAEAKTRVKAKSKTGVKAKAKSKPEKKK